jgi:hypothetical protein
MSQFTNWSDKMLVNTDPESIISDSTSNVNDEPDPDFMIDFDLRLKSLVAMALNKKPVKADKNEVDRYNKIHRDLSVNSVKKIIHNYDKQQLEKNSKYTSYKDSLKTEVNAVDENNNLDKHLDNILCKKLDLMTTEENPTQKNLEEIERQNGIAMERQDNYNSRTKALRTLIKSHDDKKKMENSKYQSFEMACLDNEIMVENDHVDVNVLDKIDNEVKHF